MPLQEIEDFAKTTVKNVRDLAIKFSDIRWKSDNMNSPSAKRWQEAKNKGDIDNLMEMAIADCVDQTLFYFFRAIDEGFYDITINSPDGKSINLSKEGLGELAGWYIGLWRKKYSEERSFFDFPYLDE